METLHRLFFALRPPEAARPYLLDEQRRFALKTLVADKRLHMTIAITDDYPLLPPGLEAAMIRIGDAIIDEPMAVVLDRIAASKRSIALRPSERLSSVHRLHRLLRTGMIHQGVDPRSFWRFSPHMTLGYHPGRPFLVETIPVSWTATEFVLIHSLVGETRHETLAVWRLGSPKAETLH